MGNTLGRLCAGSMKVGDASVHHGWTLHMAPPLPQHTRLGARRALAISYFADGAKLHDWLHDDSLKQEMQENEDVASYQDWLADLPSGGIARHSRLELLECSAVCRNSVLAPRV